MKSLFTASAILAAGLALSACASDDPPTFGERLQNQGAGLEEIGQTWSQGAEKVREGEKLVAKGREQLEDGRENVDEGEELIRDGRRMMADAESRYGQTGAVPPGAPPQ